MITATVNTSQAQGHIRPVDPGRDMGAIADLIEVAFSGEMDRAGNAVVADMRQLAILGPLLTVVDRMAPFSGGYVWEQDQRIVGNVTVTIEDHAARRYFISNVAVHPSQQGHGIGRQLMEAALTGIRRQGGRSVILQVRVDNEPAQRLYRSLGFRRFDTVVEMLRSGRLMSTPQPAVPLRRLRGGDWAALADLVRAVTPLEVQQARGLPLQALRPSWTRRLADWFEQWLSGQITWRWGLEREGRLLGVVSALLQEGNVPARLDLAVRPEARGQIEGALADFGLAALRDTRPQAIAAALSTYHGAAIQALQERSFHPVRSLDQLVIDLH
jgi:ribosomal protein S18 acetylase RimI-like enzyme